MPVDRCAFDPLSRQQRIRRLDQTQVDSDPLSPDLHWLPPSAYATLLLDIMRGDATLFNRHDGVEAQ